MLRQYTTLRLATRIAIRSSVPRRSGFLRVTLAVAATVGLSVVAPAPAHAEPPPPADPWPDIRYYEEADPNGYVQPGGLWFIAPTGQNCGIWGRGNFGCTGAIPGAPADVRHIGWINGDRAVHYDWSMAVRFPPTQARESIPPRSLIRHEGTTCAVTPDGRTYCERGPLRFLIEPTRTWLSAPWMDLSWQVLGPTTGAPSNS